MDSIEKINQLAREYSGPPPEDVEGLELALRTAAMTVGPMFMQLLPEDAAIMDQGLTEMAMKLLELRSDGSTVVTIANPDGSPLELEAGE